MTNPTELQKRHLTDDDLDDLLCGLGSPDVLAHVAGCSACGELLEAERQSLESTVLAFNDATLNWAQAKSNTIPRDLPQRQHGLLVTRGRAWSMAAALLVAVTAGIFGLRSMRHDDLTVSTNTVPAAAVPASVPVAQVSHDQIAEDDAMLRAIDSEVNQPEPSPITQYALTRTHTTVQHREPQQVMD